MALKPRVEISTDLKQGHLWYHKTINISDSEKILKILETRRFTYGSPTSIVDVERQTNETQRQDAVRRRPRDDVISVQHVRVVPCAHVPLKTRD